MTDRPARRWWPTDYMDEVMPPGMENPEGWIVPLPNSDTGAFTVASPYHDDPAEEAEREWKFAALAEGQNLEFCYCDDLGDLVMSIKADGSYVIHEGQVHPDASQFAEWFNPEGASGDTIEEFAKLYAETDGAADHIRVNQANWSHSQTFHFTIQGGKPVLQPAGNA